MTSSRTGTAVAVRGTAVALLATLGLSACATAAEFRSRAADAVAEPPIGVPSTAAGTCIGFQPPAAGVRVVRFQSKIEITLVDQIILCDPTGQPVPAAVTGDSADEQGWRAQPKLVDELLRHLARPDERMRGTCDGPSRSASWFALATADGEVLAPSVPRDRCGQPTRRSQELLAEIDRKLILED